MKKAISVLLVVVIMLSMIIVISAHANASVADIADTCIPSGTTGDCTWTIVGNELIISGNGNMGDYFYWGNRAPWKNYAATITKITINKGVTGIGKEAFYNYDQLVDVNISDTVTEIRESAFARALALTNIVISDSVVCIGKKAFEYCPKLTDITIGKSVTTIEDDAFYKCGSLKSVTIPASVSCIGNHAFGYNMVVGGSTYEKRQLTIIGYSNTEAQRYADRNGFTFIPLDVEPEKPAILGDADGSGEVDLADATIIQRAVTKIAVPYDEEQLMRADVDCDGGLTIVDATLIQRFATKVNTPYPIGEPVS